MISVSLDEIHVQQKVADESKQALDKLLARQKKERERLAAAGELSQVVWDDIDEVSVAGEVQRLQNQIAEAQHSHPEIQELDEQIKAQRKIASQAGSAYETESNKRAEADQQMSALIREVEDTTSAFRVPPVDGDELQLLFGSLRKTGGPRSRRRLLVRSRT
ncbi:hypothetical protein [Caballeronia sp. INML1]|uniref:hypothetical protein n=1 Tax=Caballeronia sp. INML1 TaxID=2921760 RepID=UPI00202799AB|nr:hypothetical protein [Caballeronia sp. INML1]